MVRVVVSNVLAAQAQGRRRFDVEAETAGDALRALPVADLILDERGVPVEHPTGLQAPTAGAREMRVVAMVSGG